MEKKKIRDLVIGDFMFAPDYNELVIDKVKIKSLRPSYYPTNGYKIYIEGRGFPNFAFLGATKSGSSLFINEEDAEAWLIYKVKQRYGTLERQINKLLEYSDTLTCFLDSELKLTDEGDPVYFKDIQKGDTVYFASVGNLEVKEYKITKKDDKKAREGNFAPIIFETDFGNVMMNEFNAYGKSVSSWNKRWYTSKNKAEIYMRKWAASKFGSIGTQVAKLMKEYDRLEEFLILNSSINVSEYEK